MERELKFLLEHAHIPALPSDYRLGEPEATLHLLDEYLDYRGNILAAGWRLRRRRADGEALRYTLKSVRGGDASGPLSERIEIERTPEESEELPSEIVLALAEAGVDTAHVLGRLQPYLTLRQERQPVAISNGDGEFALLSLDEVRAVAPTPEGECRWTELEIEFLATVPPEDRDRATRELTAWFAAQPGVTVGGESKVERAARLLSISI
ncbi:MAG: CYTH domain-containing protein [Candidatus Aquidulcis sp.]|jgi:inorganic triphosphatase YgiF|nr:MAG: CYTH domain-containing protein [Candidatus Aquidulcis sp.]